MKNRTRKVIAASAVAIMLAPAALSALPQNVDAAAVGTVSTTTPVYDANGKATGQTLPSGSSWQLGQQVTINGVAHYQVATNEYIPASVVRNVTGSANSVDSSQSQSRWVEDNPDAGKIATAKTTLNVVDAYGNSTGATLPAGSQWKIGNILHANKMIYYQVSTNQYINAQDVTVAGQTTTTNNPYITTDAQYGKTVTITNTANIVDSNGNSTGMTLPVGSKWRIADMLFVNGKNYYQVATNEWIQDTDFTVSGPTTGDNGSYITDGSGAAGSIAVTTNNVQVVNGSGTPTGATLPKGTQWKIGSQTLHYDKQTFYQVATNEFVSVAYMNIVDQTSTTPNTNTNSSVPTPSNGLIATAKKQIRTYNTSTNSYDLTLPANSAWKISKLVVNKYGSYWGQVATNQWVWITDVTLNSGLNLKTNSYYEPEFATSINK
ncbi:SLAP domain-containing protein [Companilactobacillus farciminis]|uniref:SLAP domain-containing protein n=1 Tax=Companilactobacillus farciminis TaxID=1612 RepID=UPI00232D0BCE|nr:SLAP domain-containing protein [Companilactobacillus farciminis]WCG35444.1 SLAP domain-containing protein [Companilactobacillus farciminis]